MPFAAILPIWARSEVGSPPQRCCFFRATVSSPLGRGRDLGLPRGPPRLRLPRTGQHDRRDRSAVIRPRHLFSWHLCSRGPQVRRDPPVHFVRLRCRQSPLPTYGGVRNRADRPQPSSSLEAFRDAQASLHNGRPACRRNDCRGRPRYFSRWCWSVLLVRGTLPKPNSPAPVPDVVAEFEIQVLQDDKSFLARNLEARLGRQTITTPSRAIGATRSSAGD